MADLEVREEAQTSSEVHLPPVTGSEADNMALTTTSTSTEVAAPKKVKKIIRKKRRPARPQIDPATSKYEPPAQTGTTFNIWYNKWSGGDREDKYASQTAARGRCNVARDSGYTRADNVPGSYFCLLFARGVCPRGQDCQYLHRLPGIHDLFSPNVDCFGRDKFSDYRDDMGGVGSFMRINRTIYVGRIHVSDDIEEVVARHFAEWGQVERIRVLNQRGVAFITYTNVANAEFAKEAMAHQSLDHDEILNVRWATADPNPLSQKREARHIEEQAAEAIRRALPAEFVAEIEGKDPEARKRRKFESSYGLEGYEAPDEVHFARGPNAVNPRGREGYEIHFARGPNAVNPRGREGYEIPYEERLMLENGDAYDGEQVQEPAQVQQPRAAENGIISSSTLAALNAAKVAVVSKPKSAAPAGPLVAYDSDSD